MRTYYVVFDNDAPLFVCSSYATAHAKRRALLDELYTRLLHGQPQLDINSYEFVEQLNRHYFHFLEVQGD